MMFSYPDGNGTSEKILHGKDHDSSIRKIDEMYELGINLLNEEWLEYKK